MNIIIAGTHTGIGKSVCSAVLSEALGYDYWKPVQAGDLENSDSIFVRSNVSNPACTVHSESYRLTYAASPHWAALMDGTEIRRENLILPRTDNSILIETAGGVMTPLAKDFLNIDLISHLDLPVILVSNGYLGGINHTLLSIEVLKQAKVHILGIVFNDQLIPSSMEYILEYSKLTELLCIPTFTTINPKVISDFAQTISGELKMKLYDLGDKR